MITFEISKLVNVTGLTKAWTFAFIKARDSPLVRCNEELVNYKKPQKVVKVCFLKLLLEEILVNIEKFFMVQPSWLWPTFCKMDLPKR